MNTRNTRFVSFTLKKIVCAILRVKEPPSDFADLVSQVTASIDHFIAQHKEALNA